jgi:hypothetical protein
MGQAVQRSFAVPFQAVARFGLMMLDLQMVLL